MRRRVLGGLPVAALVAASLACVPSASAKDVTITSFDGTKIAAHWFVGKGVGPDQRAPTVLEGPGWSSGGDTNAEGGSGAGSIFGVPGISGFVSHGYNVLTWDPRGFGQSGGTVEIDDPRYEGRDVQALIDWVANQPEAQLDQSCTTSKRKGRRGKRRRKRRVTCATSPDDPTIGMAGASYGGGIQLVAAGLDKRIDAIAPTIAWHSLISSLFPEGNIKFGWGSILIAAGVQGTLPGGLSSPATAAGRQDPHFYSILANGVATGTTSQDDLDWMASHGPGELLRRIQVPTLLLQGTVDTLFPLDEAVANFDEIGQNPMRTAAIKAKAKKKKKKKKGKRKRRKAATAVQRVPVKMVWFCGGHGVCLTDAGPGSAYLDQRTLAWFDRWLRGKPDVDTGPKFAWIADDGELRTSDAYPLAPAGTLHASGSGVLPIVPGQGSGALIFAGAAANAVNVPVPGPSAAANVVGAPHLDLTYQGTAAPQRTWIYAQFLNPRNGTVLGNTATPIPVTLDGQQHTISRDVELVAGRAPAGGGYTLQLTPSSSLFDLQRSTGAVTFNDVDVTMPLGDPVTASPAVTPKKHKKKHRKRRHRR